MLNSHQKGDTHDRATIVQNFEFTTSLWQDVPKGSLVSRNSLPPLPKYCC